MDTQSTLNEKPHYKAIVVDLDGTLLNDSHALSDRNRDTIRKAMELGVKVLIATGKTRASAEPIIAALKLETPGIYVQGTVVYNADGSIRHQQTMDTAAVRRIITYAESNGFDVIAYKGNQLLAKHNGSPISYITEWSEPNPTPVGPLVNIIQSTPLNKLIIVGGTPHSLKALRWQLMQQVGMHVSFTSTAVTSTLEVLPKGGSKAHGVRLALKDLGIPLENVIAMGDAENDIEMLQMVGLGIAVANASEATKKAAKEITASNIEDGVAQAIEKYVLPAPQPAATVETAPQAQESSAPGAEANPS
jgi:Cof subfamily protein (haloacid dehalogenase superfamily)